MNTIVQGKGRNELSAKVITGMEDMNWGGGSFTRQVSGISCLTEVLRAIGRNTDYVEVMGLSGAALKLTLNPGICPSGAAAHYDRIAARLQEGEACADFPWDKTFTPENRRLEAGILKQSLADERAAITEIERALESSV